MTDDVKHWRKAWQKKAAKVEELKLQVNRLARELFESGGRNIKLGAELNEVAARLDSSIQLPPGWQQQVHEAYHAAGGPGIVINLIESWRDRT